MTTGRWRTPSVRCSSLQSVTHRAILALGLLSACQTATATPPTIDTVLVSNTGNLADPNTGSGAVSYRYRIGTTEVTNAQYTAFLNAKAASDPLELYGTLMGSTAIGGITRSGSDGSYSYATISGRENMPVNYVSWYDAIRFTNWLHNGQGTGDTETGAYTLGALGGGGVPINGLSITRNVGAQWFLPDEDEWYKAAFHKNDGDTANYFHYPTSSNTGPVPEVPAGGLNSANYFSIVNDLTDAGAYVSSASPYGTFDQGGNVWEWNESPFFGTQRGIRGGSYDSVVQTFLSALTEASVSGDPKAQTHDNLGFRVAAVALLGDFNGNIALDANDIDILCAHVGDPNFHPDDLDLDGSGAIDVNDMNILVHDIFNTEYGDGNLDGKVDIGDFTLWGDGFGTLSPSWGNGDFNKDGSVDIGDFTLWGTTFGFDNSLPGPVPIPEPSTLLLALPALILLARWRRRDNRRNSPM